MEWLLIVALGLWLYLQGRSLKDVRQRLQTLEGRALASEIPERPRPAPTGPSPWAAAAEPAPKQPGPTSVDRPSPEPKPAIAAPIARPQRPPLNLAAWISEHGLAWLGGGALVLGGLFLVTYAAQRGVFTPALRIAAAVVLGLVMIGASEWVRRLDRDFAGRKAPAAALLAGAGAATLYGAVWASDRLYGFIGLQASAPLLALISAALLGLAFRHGAPLALAALAGAYLAPVVTNGPDWGDGPLTGYLILILLTGYATAALRRWDEAAWLAAFGAAVWAVANLSDAQNGPSALLLFLSPASAIAAALWRRRREIAPPEGSQARVLAWWWTPAAVLALSAALSLALWGTVDGEIHAVQAGLLSAGLALLGAIIATARLGPTPAQIAPYAVIPLALFGLAQVADPVAWKVDLLFPTLGVILVLIAAAFAAARVSRDRLEGLASGAGAVCAALALTAIAQGLDMRHLAWSAPAVAAGLMVLAAAWLGRRSEAPERDLGLALWIWPAAFLAARALEQGLQDAALPPALAALALAAAALHARLRWRGLGSAALAATVAMLGGLIGNIVVPALQGVVTVWTVVAAVVVAVGMVWAAGRLVRRDMRDLDLGDALTTGALVAALMGGFLLLRFWGSGEATLAGQLDRLTELAFGTILLLAAGLVSSRGGEGRIGRYRGPVFLVLGLAYGLFAQGVIANPLWPSFQSTIKGPPILDAMMLAYLAPALMLAAAVRLRVSPQRAMVGLYAAGSVVFAVLWAVLELRRLFQGPTLHMGLDTVGRAEGAAYALLALIVARLLIWAAERAGRTATSLSEVASEARSVAEGLAWAAAVFAAAVFAHAASPWWGPITRPFESHAAVVLLLGLYAAGVGAWLSLARHPRLGRLARPAAVLQLFVLLTLLIRYGFRGLDMASANAEARLETWAFSAIWALYGLAALVLGARLRDLAVRWTGLAILLFTTAKVFIFDMARLDGVVRAASFLALGALLIAAALAARRFGGLGLKPALAGDEPAEG